MAGRTTAYVLVGEYAVGPFADREWKARHGIALIEKHRLVWMPGPVAHGQGEPMPVEPIYFPNGLSPAEELTVLLASVVLQDPDVLHTLEVEGFTHAVDLSDRHVDAWPHFSDEQLDHGVDWPPGLVDQSVSVTKDRMRLGVVRLEDRSVLDARQVEWLRAVGFDVDEFTRRPVPDAQ